MDPAIVAVFAVIIVEGILESNSTPAPPTANTGFDWTLFIALLSLATFTFGLLRHK